MANVNEKIKEIGTSTVNTDAIGMRVEELVNFSKNQRRSFERRWYDNNFFDDGFHYRFLQRTTNKIIDLSERASIYNPMRAIPKASRQIRGVVNLLVSSDPTPTVYPERILKERFIDMMGQLDEQSFKQAQDVAKEAARKRGFWLEEEFKAQEITEKMAFLLLLAAKHGVAFMQVWPDAVAEKIKTQVYDAFDMYCYSILTDLEDSPYVIKGVPKIIAEIKADERFDKEQLAKIAPDNRQTSSEIKEAYLSARFGKRSNPDNAASLVLKEAFLKEYLNPLNMTRIKLQDDGDKILKGKKEGDMVIRQVFVAGNVWLRDRYTNLSSYPFVDYRFEPGPIYQVPLIERFIPQNKSLDAAVSRVEKYLHTMVSGAWLKRQGEQMQITNDAGGQVIEYTQTPPTQAAISPIPNFVFSYMNFLTQTIEEQGVTTSTLGKIPGGVKANAAIESIKESEYASLVVASRRLKQTTQKIAEKFLEIADRYFVTPKEMAYLDKGKPEYFSVIGGSVYDQRKKLKVETPEDVITIKKDLKVDIEIQSGMAFTREGKRATSKELIDTMLQYAQAGLIPPEAIKVVLEQWLKNYQFGATADFMEAMDEYLKNGGTSPTQDQGVKVALLEVFKDLMKEGILPNQDVRVQESTLGAAQAIKDTGIYNKPEAKQETKTPSESISFKDLPPQGQAQMAAQAGIQLSPEEIEAKQQQDQQVQQQQAQQAMQMKQQSMKGKGETQ
jgi:hypothetical protein